MEPSRWTRFREGLWRFVASWYEDVYQPKRIKTTITRYPGRFCINGNWVFIPKGTRIRWPVDQFGEYDNG